MTNARVSVITLGKSPDLALKLARIKAMQFSAVNDVSNTTVSKLVGKYWAEIVEPTSKVPKQVAILGSKGALVMSPWFRVSRDCSATMASLSTKLKLCPSSRLRSEDASRSIKQTRNGQVFNPGANWRDYKNQDFRDN